MFTGIVEELGAVSQMTTSGDSMKLTITAKTVLSDVKLGDSISINGICLTVTSHTLNNFTVDVMPETYRATSLSKVSVGSKVNLERSLNVGGRLGGHFVTGHVDGVGIIKNIIPSDNALNYTINIDRELLKYCIYKGSIAVDGTSLTIFAINQDTISLALIPHTVKNSVLGSKQIGDIVNIECDMLGKYVVNLLQNTQVAGKYSAITKGFLTENGFL